MVVEAPPCGDSDSGKVFKAYALITPALSNAAHYQLVSGRRTFLSSLSQFV